MKISAAVITYNNQDTIERTVVSIARQGIVDILIIDNGSSDHTLARVDGLVLQAASKIRVIRNHSNVGFSANATLALRKAEADYLLLVNPDSVLQDGWIDAARPHIESGVALIGSRIVDPQTNQTIAGVKFDRFLCHKFTNVSTQAFCPSGAVLLMNVRSVLEVGGFDEVLFLYFEEFDMAVRLLRCGKRFAIMDEALCYHSLTTRSTEVSSVSGLRLFHYFKNRTALMLIHFDLGNLIESLAASPILFVGSASYVVSKTRRATAMIELMRATAWNLKHVRQILARRKIIRAVGHHVSLGEILDKNSIEAAEFLSRIFGKT